ncbi:hypothetical protein AHF37_09401 [Paragonimus kellicotti]|nr:hypothetical protein AHF37_09401 [Paragonimus kellicotti]
MQCACRGGWPRPYHVGNTGSRPITEVKQRWARLVLAWVTGWEYRVLRPFCASLSASFCSKHTDNRRTGYTQNAQICAPNRGPFARVCTRNPGPASRITHNRIRIRSYPNRITLLAHAFQLVCVLACVDQPTEQSHRLCNTLSHVPTLSASSFTRVRPHDLGQKSVYTNTHTHTHTHAQTHFIGDSRTNTREPIAETLCGPRFVRACWTRRMRRRATDRLSGSKRTACHIEINQPGCLTAREPKCLTYCLLPVCLSISCLPDCLHVGTISTAC